MNRAGGTIASRPGFRYNVATNYASIGSAAGRTVIVANPRVGAMNLPSGAQIAAVLRSWLGRRQPWPRAALRRPSRTRRANGPPGRSSCWPRKSSSRIRKLAPRVDDATYLRRVWLDIVGDIPTPEHVTAFLLDPAKDKRERVVRELLANPQYGQNWARYWRDVILSRQLEDRAQIVANPLVADLTEKFNENESWDKIATEFITATGDVRENGATAIQMAQDGRTEETTAEMSRIFLGIQIQCAQCHDHPTTAGSASSSTSWPRSFRGLPCGRCSRRRGARFEVVSDDRPELRRRPNPDARIAAASRSTYMPDLENPAAPGTQMQPKFFLTSAKLPFGTPDAERRGTVAEWMTENPWFATAFVNRMWGELVGEGFYEPIDDMGPDRKPSAPKTVEILSRSFAESGYDVKWLFRTICATEAYQRESRPRREADGTPFVANVAQPLRSDQLFNAMLTAVDVDGAGSERSIAAAGPAGGKAVRPECDRSGKGLKSRSATTRAIRAKRSSARSRRPWR